MVAPTVFMFDYERKNVKKVKKTVLICEWVKK